MKSSGDVDPRLVEVNRMNDVTLVLLHSTMVEVLKCEF